MEASVRCLNVESRLTDGCYPGPTTSILLEVGLGPGSLLLYLILNEKKRGGDRWKVLSGQSFIYIWPLVPSNRLLHLFPIPIPSVINHSTIHYFVL